MLLVNARQRAAGNANREQGRRGSVFQRLAIAFLKRSLQERERLFVAGNRENPQVKARLRIVAAEQQKPSIEGPTGCRFALIRFQQQFIGSSAAR